MKGKLGQNTLCLFTKRDNKKISQICLAKKSRGFGKGKWNGFGGKMDSKLDPTIEEAALRELREEAGEIEVLKSDLIKVAEVIFIWPHKREWDKIMHVYLIDRWEGEIKGSEEMITPTWYSIDDLSSIDMWDADLKWFPFLFEGKKIKARIEYNEDGKYVEWKYELAEF